FFLFSSRRRHTRSKRDWSSDVCSSDLRNTFLLFVLCYFENSGGKLVRSMPHTSGNKTATAIVTRTIPIILSTNPAFAISVMRKYPDPNTTAFGGVATGSINAQEAAT